MVRRSIPSPCIQVCTMDTASGWCLGCGRTLQEIAMWSRFTPEERARVESELAKRLAQVEMTDRR